MADLWGRLRQAHQSLPLRGAGDSGQLQAVGLQLGDGGEEGGRRQGGGGEVGGTAALLLVPAEIEGHLLPYRRRPGAPLVLHRCGGHQGEARGSPRGPAPGTPRCSAGLPSSLKFFFWGGGPVPRPQPWEGGVWGETGKAAAGWGRGGSLGSRVGETLR